jgi:alpha-galactosidase
MMLENINRNINGAAARVTAYAQRRKALAGADFVVNAVQVGGYRPGTVIDFEVPKRYGLRQTIGDTLGIGGIFRTLRTLPVLLDFARDIEEVCPQAWLLNYSNPMAMLTGALLRYTGVKTVGLCHSVQACVADYVTESSEHNAEYLPWFIEERYPQLIERFAIPLDEYPRRCEQQIADWARMRSQLTENIMEAIETDSPFRIAGNVLNLGPVTNLPTEACVEVPCLVDRNGVTPCRIGALPPQLREKIISLENEKPVLLK